MQTLAQIRLSLTIFLLFSLFPPLGLNPPSQDSQSEILGKPMAREGESKFVLAPDKAMTHYWPFSPHCHHHHTQFNNPSTA